MGIELRSINKTFGTYSALRDVNLDIKDGELMALLGPSGSGKTTLLRIIAGLEFPDAGPSAAILFNGEQIDFAKPAQRQVGFVFQHYALFRTMSVFENVAFGLRVRPKKLRPSENAIREKVTELLQLIQLEGLANRYPSQLSGGQRQRVALARALAIEPKILLLDEPFGALDAKVRQGLRRWLRKLHDEIHITSVLVTHDQEEALEVADRIVVMNQARIEQVGTPDEVFHKPASPFVMDFLGNVNLFHGRRLQGEQVALGKSAEDGQAAKIFVRPHDLDLDVEDKGKPAIRAAVQRVQTAGALVKIEVLTDAGETVNVEMPHERFRLTPVKKDDVVFVSLRDVRVFFEDYSI
ncbi:MAG TPA: sulfate ABC transporter ATP-binding protein [Bryobacteraceae bacterium]|nr:sulfate ABC transporter ATP-binding protein [Bryobacteraceae bacterium]